MSGDVEANKFFVAFDLSGFRAVPQSVKVDYQTYWNVYNRIQIYDSNVSTVRGEGDKKATYYQYVSYDERNSFINGQMLHIRRYPGISWAPVRDN